MNENRPKTTVVLRCKNNAWVIDRMLAALFSQTYQDFELLVVDSGSTDSTLETVEQYPHRLIEVAPEDYVPGTVLNQAISQTDTPVVLFVNADCVLATPESLGHLVAAFDDPEVMAAFGRQVVRPEADTWVRRDYEQSFPEKGEAPPWITLSLPVAGMRRSAWEQQAFYTDAWGSEDSHWGVRARERGWKIAYVPDAVAMHSHNYTLKQLYGRRFIEGEADSFIYGGGDTIPKLVGRTVMDIVRDIPGMLRAHDASGLAWVLPRRAVCQWGYYVGRQHGARRQAEGSRDVKHGQQVVLARHESIRGKG
jgi:rhamnosyltransferase